MILIHASKATNSRLWETDQLITVSMMYVAIVMFLFVKHFVPGLVPQQTLPH